MGLKQQFAAIATERRTLCKSCLLLSVLDDTDRESLTAAFADESMSSSLIFRVLKLEGHSISISAIKRHRRSECQ